ncbi:phosphoribosylaminoimidazole carboxylase [Methylacidiphilum kamchatkense Kam1]|uniref:N5-carboxyaminoimidazole ribonucleotide synthase n=1 Tax=Methylacidiphilum kamchatkense Kam1 TaxID=1202785 RepID=A0A0C1V351_9BACT|nr:5-(carboxyamino)imidazole ribonucleotide synthase [Methylacidiphilum kamchatkense]KIE58120.1 phosphoribosylaminoimidazole carboxylase [Methylacidiphilum kamchatkense Kam1]QDQ41552.1 5-(carboxyamino)imidazole ribonucleotide synthase [Methylacidiphilum kamchatkense Kam1]
MKEILPGATIGILGGGQLGRMAAMEARRLGYGVVIYDPDPSCPAAAIADKHWIGGYDDIDKLLDFAAAADVLTYEFENISSLALRKLEEESLLFPSAAVLEICQHRVREKEFLSSRGFPTVSYKVVNRPEELSSKAADLGFPSILKTAQLGYDGKGQVSLSSIEDCFSAWENIGKPAIALLEKRLELLAEFSVIIGRDHKKNVSFFPIPRNFHKKGILDFTIVPSGLGKRLEKEAKEIAFEIAAALDLIGLLAVEFFLTENEDIVVNELAPRPHNSGHFSLDICLTSQFEQLLRIICNLPLGATSARSNGLMRNLLGDLWRADNQPNWAGLLKLPGLKLHLYGKKQPRVGRKMGHYCIVGENMDDILALDTQALQILENNLS